MGRQRPEKHDSRTVLVSARDPAVVRLLLDVQAEAASDFELTCR
jgi:hypothetical protein